MICTSSGPLAEELGIKPKDISAERSINIAFEVRLRDGNSRVKKQGYTE